MYKKLILSIALVLCCFFAIKEENIYIAEASSSIVVTEDTKIENQEMTIDSMNTGSIITVSSGNTLQINSVVISGTGSADTLIEVESGAVLNINDLVVSGISVTNVIENYGELVINKLTVDCGSTYDIYNSSESCTLGDVSIDSVYIDSGYITVNGNTKLSDTISIDCSSAKESLPSLMVKGNGVYASYFVDRFTYVGDYKYTNSSNPFDTTEYPAILDYVGATDKVKTASTNILETLGLGVGDIILTAETGTFTDEDTITLAGMYTTMNQYMNSSDYTGGTYKYRSGLYESGVYVVMDNYHIAVSTGAISEYSLVSNSNVSLEVNSMYNDSLREAKTIDKMGVGGSWLVFVDRLATNYTISTSSNITYSTLYESSSHIAILLTHSGEVLNASIDISFEEIVNKTVNALLKDDSFVYSGSDHYDKLLAYYVYEGTEYELLVREIELIDAGNYTIEVYTNDSSVTLINNTLSVEITPKEITIVYTQPSSTYTGSNIEVSANAVGTIDGDFLSINLTNNIQSVAGSYVVTASISDDNYIIAEGYDTYNFTILKATIDESLISFDNITCEYSGVVVLPKLTGVNESIIDIEYDYDRENIVNIGTHNVTITLDLLDTVNYNELEKITYTASVTITPRVLIPTLSVSEFEYTGYVPTLEIIYDRVVAGEKISANYTMPTQAVVGDYEITLALDTTDSVTANYVIKDGCETLSYKIIKATIDMSIVGYSDEEIEYTGDCYIPCVKNLPCGAKVEYDAEPSVFKLGIHTITAYFTLEDTANYEALSMTSKTITLTINPQQIDVSGVVLQDLAIDYDGSAHSIAPENMPNNVIYSSETDGYTDAGNYTITITLEPVDENYVLVGRDDMTLSATLTINKIDYDLSEIVFADTTLTYNGEEQTIPVVGSLPEGLTIGELEKKVNVGAYDIELEFINSNSNYNNPESLTAKLIIEPKELIITLLEDYFVYNGSEFEVDYELDGIIGNDTIEVTLLNNRNTLAGDYTAIVDSVSNDNYSLDRYSLTYTIAKANIDMTGITLQDKEIEYSGVNYIPSISGTLPSYVTCNITHGEIKNVGKYNIVASFTVDSNYNKPNDLTAIIEIVPKAVVVQFTNHLNLMYNGETQYIGVEIVGMVDNEEYTIVYSAEPKEAGNYMCEVILASDSNYTIPGDTRCYFDIHTDHKTFTSDDYVLNVSNGVFKVNNELSVNKIQLTTDVKNKINTLHDEIEFIDSIKIVADHSEEPISVGLELKDLNLARTKGITLYSLSSDGRLEAIDYEVEGNALKFSALPNSSFIIVKDKVDNSIMTLVIVVLGLLVVVLGFSLVMVVKNIREKKSKSKNTNE